MVVNRPEAKWEAKAKERRVGAPMGSRAVVITAGCMGTVQSGVRKEKTAQEVR